MQGQWVGRGPMLWATLGGRGRTAQDLEAWNELIQVSGSEAYVSNLGQKGEDEPRRCFGHMETGDGDLAKKIVRQIG